MDRVIYWHKSGLNTTTGTIVSIHAYDEFKENQIIMDRIDHKIERLAETGYIIDSSYVKSSLSKLLHRIEHEQRIANDKAIAVSERYISAPQTTGNQHWGYVVAEWHGNETIDFGLWDQSNHCFVGNPCVFSKGSISFHNMSIAEIARMVGVFSQKYSDSSGIPYERTLAVLKSMGFKSINRRRCGIIGSLNFSEER